MGVQLLALYDKAKEIGSVKAQMRLAMKSGVSSVKAESEPDSPELIAKMTAALQEIQAEFN